MTKAIDQMVATEDLAFAFMPKIHAASHSLKTGNLDPLQTANTLIAADLSKASSDRDQISGVVRNR